MENSNVAFGSLSTDITKTEIKLHLNINKQPIKITKAHTFIKT